MLERTGPHRVQYLLSAQLRDLKINAYAYRSATALDASVIGYSVARGKMATPAEVRAALAALPDAPPVPIAEVLDEERGRQALLDKIDAKCAAGTCDCDIAINAVHQSEHAIYRREQERRETAPAPTEEEARDARTRDVLDLIR
jgi:hypothetical protein